MALQINTVKTINVNDWDELVKSTYNRPYSFQQQDDCKDRGSERISVPEPDPFDYENDTLPEKVNHPEMGVSFAAWLARDPKQKLSIDNDDYAWTIRLWWERNFYPDVSMIINDLHAKGLLPEGEYQIVIDW